MSEENLVIHKVFSKTAFNFSQKAALKIKKDGLWQKFTYRQIQEESLKLAAFLIKEGFKKGDFAVLILENRPEWAIIYLGIMQAGLTCVPLNPELTRLEIKNLILDSGAKVVFCSEPVEGIAVRTLLLDDQPFKDISLDNIAFPQVSPEDIASLIYTSGTTANPKGVLLSHKNICSNFRSIEKLRLCLPTDNFLSILPLYHAYSFMVTLIVPLFLGATATYAYSFKAQDLRQIIKEAGITILVGVPQMFNMLYRAILERIKKIPLFLRPVLMPFIKIKLQREFAPLRFFACGGARLDPKTARGLSSLGFKIVEGYGLTEASPVVTFNPLEKIKFGSVGRNIPDVEIKISQPDSSGIGEVIIRGDNVMQGYFKQPGLTNERIKEGWLHTGDLGYLDREGYLFLTGRGEDVIVLSSGKNIYPEELEEYYQKAASIKELCIAVKEEEAFGQIRESLFAVVVPNLEFLRQNNETNIQARVRWDLENLSKELPAYKRIMGFLLTREELPRTALRKIKRYQVKEKYLKAALEKVGIQEEVFSEEDRGLLKTDSAKKVMQYISSELNKPVFLDSHLEIDLSLDSLARVELGAGLEARLGLKIADELLYRVSTVRELLLELRKLRGKAGVSLKEEEAVKKNWGQILREAPVSQILKKVRIDFGILDAFITGFFKGAFLFILRIFWLLKVEGRDNLPKQGPYLICPNHAGYLDGLFIFGSLPFKDSLRTYFLGYNFIFQQPWIHWAVKFARLVSIDTSIHLTEAMQMVSFLASQKKIVCIFPEGTRSVDTSVNEFKKGVGILIKELDIPAVPVYIKGSHHAWPRGRLLPRFYPVKVIFGRAVSLKGLLKNKDSRMAANDYETIAQNLRKEVLKLIC